MIQPLLKSALVVGLALALLSLAIVGAASFRSAGELRAATQSVNRTYEILSHVDHVHSALRDAESHQRGYILTGDSAYYLAAYHAARARLEERLGLLERLLPAGAQPRELRAAIATRLRQLEDRITLYRDRGMAAAVASLQNDEDVSRISEAIDAEINELAGSQRALLSARTATARRTATEMRRVAVIGPLLATALVFLLTLLILREMSKRSAALEALQKQERLLVQFMESLPLGILVGGHDGRVIYVNTKAQQLVGIKAVPGAEYDDLVNVYITGTDKLYPPERWPINRALQGESARVDDMEIRDRGRVVPLEVSGAPIFDAQGKVEYAIVAFADISERLELNRMKDEFLSVVSHELRTPLTSVRGALGMLASGKLGELAPKGKRMLDIAVADTDRLVRLINDILDVERLEAGRQKLNKQRVLAADLTARAVDAMRPLADRAEITLATYSVGMQLWADADCIVQTLVNLIGNAIKFSPPGSTIEVGANQLGNEALFFVRDEGRGIPPDKLASIFDRFRQVDASDARAKGGIGLGLAISRSLVIQHGGRIWAESDGQSGSTFYFTLPLQYENTTTLSELAGPSPLVLVAEDDPSVVEVLRSILLEHGFDVVSVSNGAKATDKARELQPAAIILDILMPEVDGKEALAVIRSDPTTAEIPVIVLSVLGRADSTPLLGRVTEWLNKPIEPKALIEALDRALVERLGAPNVLLVEDDATTAAELLQHFERRGLIARVAADSGAAARMLSEVTPSLIVLDFMLSDATGFEFVARCRAVTQLAQLPLIVFSAASFDSGARERLRLGPTEFLRKGDMDAAEVAHRVVMALYRSRLMEGTPHA